MYVCSEIQKERNLRELKKDGRGKCRQESEDTRVIVASAFDYDQ